MLWAAGYVEMLSGKLLVNRTLKKAFSFKAKIYGDPQMADSYAEAEPGWNLHIYGYGDRQRGWHQRRNGR